MRKQNIYRVAVRIGNRNRKVKISVDGYTDAAIDKVMETLQVPFEAIKGIRFLETV